MFGSRTTTTTAPRHGMFTRSQKVHRTHGGATHHGGTTTTTTRTGRHNVFGRRKKVVHTKRHASIGDKISGAMLKLKGSLTNRPGVKAAGTKRMHGTDGRGSVRY